MNLGLSFPRWALRFILGQTRLSCFRDYENFCPSVVLFTSGSEQMLG